jgi:prepilin-type N-terminal cleavage/methylation domain-containing protein
MRSPAKAFTLIELLIVVAIIAILAAIAVPNFLEAQVRSKVARVRADMRSYAVGMEAYRVDNNRYPIPSDGNGWFITNPTGAVLVSPFETRLPILLTTPIAYVTALGMDPFATHRVGESKWYSTLTYDYMMIRQLNAPRVNWARAYRDLFRDLMGRTPPTSVAYSFFSYGPDRDHDADVPHAGPTNVPHVHGTGAIYDPTNGTVSSGDIYYLGPGWGFIGG